MTRKDEHYIQCSIVEYLQYVNIFCFAVANGIFFNIKNPIQKSQYMNYLKKEGFVPGVSDLVLLPGNNKIIFVETKTVKGALNKNQKKFRDKILDLGYNYEIVRSVKDMEIIYKKIKMEKNID